MPRARTSADVEAWFRAWPNPCCEITNRFSRSTAMFSASLRRSSSCCLAKDEGLVPSRASGTSSSKNPGTNLLPRLLMELTTFLFRNESRQVNFRVLPPLKSSNVTFSRDVQPSDPEVLYCFFFELELSLDTSELCFGQASVR